MTKDERLESPDRFYPEIPGYMIPLFQSQARQEVKIEEIEMKVDGLQKKQDSLPCAEHAEKMGRIEERLNSLEKTKTKEDLVEAGEEIVASAARQWIHDHPKLTSTGIIGSVLSGIAVAHELGLLDWMLGGGA